MDPSFSVDLPASVSGSISAASVTTSTTSVPASVSRLGAGAADGEDEEVSLNSPDDNHLQLQQQQQQQQQSQHPGTGTGTGTGSSWLGNIKRRAAVACRRCRRQRSKCEHEKAKPPCKSCKEAGLSAEHCVFPERGQPGNDRDYRHPRQRKPPKTPKAAAKAAAKAPDGPGAEGRASAPRRPRPPPDPSKPVDVWKIMPPEDDILDAVDRFNASYFQLSFLAKQQFRNKLQNELRSVDPFLLLGILGISARMTPALIKAHGSGVKAAEYFMDKQFDLATREIYMGPTLERCQAFYLLSLAQQGSGHKNASYLNVGIATRMSTLMQLHREETYDMHDPTDESIISAESARRTMWMLHSQDSLHSGPYSPVTLGAPDITTLLPCNEEDFAAGRHPISRAALPDSPPALEEPHLVRDPGRSLFASLMQIHHYWGTVSRRAATFAREAAPWDSGSEFWNMKQTLDDWEAELPATHHWSKSQLFYFKSRGLDLSYLSVTMMPRLCNIVLRRPYLGDVMLMDQKTMRQQVFFAAVSRDMFQNVYDLFEQIDAQFTGRSVDESVGAQMAAFCVYVCGLFSTYLCLYPNLCPNPVITRQGPAMVERTREILSECERVWPLASRWVDSLDRAYNQPHQAPLMSDGSMTDSKDPVPQAWQKRSNSTPPTEPGQATSTTNSDFHSSSVGSPLDSVMSTYATPHPDSQALQQQTVSLFQQSGQSFAEVGIPHVPQPQAAAIPFSPQDHIPSNLMAHPPPGQIYIRSQQQPDVIPMMMASPFHASPATPHHATIPQQHGYMLNQPGPSGVYPQTGPDNDGFEDELQVYMRGKEGHSLPANWNGSF